MSQGQKQMDRYRYNCCCIGTCQGVACGKVQLQGSRILWSIFWQCSAPASAAPS